MSQQLSPFGPVQLEQALETIIDATRKAVQFGERSFYESGNEFDDEIAKDHLYQAWRTLLAILELGSHQILLNQALAEFDKFKKDPLLTDVGPEEPYLVWPYKIRHYCDTLAAIHLPTKERLPKGRVAALISTLKRCEKYILSRRLFAWVPCSEGDVHSRIEELLQCYYHPVVHKPSLAKPIKHFVPDTGLPSIKTLVEYKYVASEEDAKKIVDEILADLGGYHSDDYDSFVFVIYETSRFARLKDWEGILTQSKSPAPTKVVLLKGIVPTGDDHRRAEAHIARMASMKKKARGRASRKSSERTARRQRDLL